MVGSCDEGCVLVFDDKKLRRAEVASLLTSWAASHHLKVLDTEGDELLKLPEHPSCRMCVVSLGGESLDQRHRALIRCARGLFPQAPIVVLSDEDDVEDVLDAFRAGSNGFLTSMMAVEEALAVLTFVLLGGCYAPPSVVSKIGVRDFKPSPERRPKLITTPAGQMSIAARHRISLAERPAREDDDASFGGAQPASTLTGRQRDVLNCLSSGQSNKEIARALDMSEATVKVHIRQVMKKLGVANRTQAALCAGSALQQDAILAEHALPFRRMVAE